jgi:hypothetical protein
VGLPNAGILHGLPIAVTRHFRWVVEALREGGHDATARQHHRVMGPGAVAGVRAVSGGELPSSRRLKDAVLSISA